MTYCVIDLETDGETTFKRFCNPLDPRHKVVLAAFKVQNCDPDYIYSQKFSVNFDEVWDKINLKEINLLIGHNLKFDMLWFWNNERFQKWLRNGGRVYDTATGEHYIRGLLKSNSKEDGLSLDALSRIYGGTQKTEKVKNYYKEGVLSSQIPAEILIKYCIEDVKNTNIIAQAQFKKIKELGLEKCLAVQMLHYLVLTEIEYNGMYVNQDKAKELTHQLELKLQKLEHYLLAYIDQHTPFPVQCNLASTQHLSLVLFGGELKTKIKKEVLDEYGKVICVKSGKNKGNPILRLQELCVRIKGLGYSSLLLARTKTNKIKLDKDILLELQNKTDKKKHSEFLLTLLEYKNIEKRLSTYLYRETNGKTTGHCSLILPHTGCIHSEFSTISTSTGRVSSKHPNIQNLPPDILELYSSRFGENGVIAEFDASQLEVVLQAYVTQSDKFIEDIKKGIDFHIKRLSYVENKSYNELVHLCNTDPEWKAKRKAVKTVSFQKAYGAFPEKIAAETDLPLELVEKIFNLEDQDYPEIGQVCGQILDEVASTAKPTKNLLWIKNKQTGTYFTRPTEFEHVGTYKSLTGKLYSFCEKATLTKRGDIFRYFKSTQTQNYPIQGLAGEMLPVAVNSLWSFLLQNRDKLLIINEVHDSLVFDIKKEHLDFCISEICARLNNIAEEFEKAFGLKFNVPLKFDYKYGDSWKDCK